MVAVLLDPNELQPLSYQLDVLENYFLTVTKKSRQNVLKTSETQNLIFTNNPLNPVADVLKEPVCLLSAASSDHSTDRMQVSVIRTGFRDTAEKALV